VEDLSTKTVCIYDHGLFVSLAPLLAGRFKRVYYVSGTAGSFPTTAEYSIGSGIPGVTRLNDWADAERIEDQIDLHVIPDLYLAGKAVRLRRQGARVWGSGEAEILELDRLRFKTWAADVGLNVGRYEVVRGMDEAEAFMKSHPGWFMKTAGHAPPGRGDFETLRSRSYDEVKYRMREIRTRLGDRAERVQLIFEKPITDAIELATDCYSVDGQYPDRGVLGLEMKAEGYLGKWVNYGDYPESLRKVNSAFSILFKKQHYRNHCPNECRIDKKGKAWVLDPCLRFGRPPLSILMMITNWPEIFWAGGGGELVQPQFADKWCAEACLYSDYAEEHPTPIEIPKGLEDHVKLSNYCISGGRPIVVPMHYKLSGIGSIVATGSTMNKAIEKCREVMKEVTGYDVKATDSFDGAAEQVAKMKEFGIEAFG